MIGLQHVGRYISSSVIAFHRRNGYGRGKSWRHRGTTPQRRMRQEKGRHGNKTGQRHRRRNDGRQKETETVTCRVGSERSPCPVLVCFWRQEADVGWECDVKAATNWDFRSCKNSPARLLFFAPVLMRRRSLRLPSPAPFPNSDGNTGAFFRAENYHREFSVPKTGGPNAEVFALRVIFSGGLVK